MRRGRYSTTGEKLLKSEKGEEKGKESGAKAGEKLKTYYRADLGLFPLLHPSFFQSSHPNLQITVILTDFTIFRNSYYGML
jgi:hypothetical protein